MNTQASQTGHAMPLTLLEFACGAAADRRLPAAERRAMRKLIASYGRRTSTEAEWRALWSTLRGRADFFKFGATAREIPKAPPKVRPQPANGDDFKSEALAACWRGCDELVFRNAHSCGCRLKSATRSRNHERKLPARLRLRSENAPSGRRVATNFLRATARVMPAR
jgi:hypothetical protein